MKDMYNNRFSSSFVLVFQLEFKKEKVFYKLPNDLLKSHRTGILSKNEILGRYRKVQNSIFSLFELIIYT